MVRRTRANETETVCFLLSGDDSILEPLSFPEQPADVSSAPGLQGASTELLVCLFCPESVPLLQKDVLLKHLLLEHKLVIADVRLIADLPQYEAFRLLAAVLNNINRDRYFQMLYKI